MRFHTSYRERLTLRSGRVVELRLLRPHDAALLVEGFERLSDRSRYRRFLTPKRALTEAEVRYLCDVDQVDHVAIGALDAEADRARGLGVVRFVRDEHDPSTADMALTVVDEAQHQGLGHALLERAIAAARERGISRFHVDVLTSNAEMLNLLKEESVIVGQRIDGGVLSADCDIAERRGRPHKARDPRNCEVTPKLLRS